MVEKPVEVVRTIERIVEVPKKTEPPVSPTAQVVEAQPSKQSVSSAPTKRTAEEAVRSTEAERRRIDDRYRAFLRTLGLSPEKIDRFVDLKLALAEARQDLQAAVEQSGGLGGTAGVEAIRTSITKPMWDEISQLLGPNGYEALRDFERTSAIRPTVDTLFRVAAVSITEEQAAQLTRLILKNTEPYRAKSTDIGHTSRVRWDAVAQDASGIMSPEQIEVIRARAIREDDRK